ncbi:MAG: DUF58 domain-containing protein [Aristaeellaceae bacterium]
MTRRRGWWLAWCAALGVLHLFENGTATRILLLGSLMLPLLDRAMLGLAVRRARVALDAPEQAEKGSGIPLAIRVEGVLPPVQLRARVRCENRLTGDTGDCTAWVQRRGMRQAEHRLLVQAEQCGMLTVRLTLTVSGVLGLHERVLPGEAQAVIWIPPALRPLQAALADDAQEEGPGRSVPPYGPADDAFGVRAYVPGDPVRRIHWKLSEKLDAVMVRTPESPLSEQVLLVLDLSAAAGCARIDALTEMLFSLSRCLLEGGTAHGILWLPEAAEQPELRRVESEEDYAAFQADYFVLTPERHRPLAPGGAAEAWAHVVLLGEMPMAQSFGQRPGQRVTRLDSLPDNTPITL